MKVIIFAALAFGVVLIAWPALTMISGPKKTVESLPPSVVTSGMVADKPLQAELEIARVKLRAAEERASILASENSLVALELRQALARVAELSMNQQPELTKEYSDLKDKYNRMFMELNNLKTIHADLAFRYDELAKVHTLCEGN